MGTVIIIHNSLLCCRMQEEKISYVIHYILVGVLARKSGAFFSTYCNNIKKHGAVGNLCISWLLGGIFISEIHIRKAKKISSDSRRKISPQKMS